MDRRRAAGALLALAACIARSAAAPTASNHTSLDFYDGAPEGCYYNFQHYGEGDRIMTNEPCLNCTCHNRMLMCYLRVCPFTKPIGQDCTVEKRADQCCPIVTCPDVPVDLLTSTSTSSPAEYGGTGVGKYDKYGCSINGRYFPEGSKVPPTPNKPCEHCYCIRNMTTCVMQECTLHVDGCTPIYHKDVCCPVRYSCDHPEDEIPLLDDMSTTVRPTPGFLLTTTTIAPVTQTSQNCVHDDKVFVDGALIKTDKACEHCYCMKGDIVCVVQECGTPMENEGKNCTSLPPREGQCCPDTYICEGDELTTEPNELTTQPLFEDLTTLPSRRVSAEGSGYRKETDDLPFTEPSMEFATEGSGDILLTTEKPYIDDESYTSTDKFHDTKAPILTETEQTTSIQKEYTGTTDSNVSDETSSTDTDIIDDTKTITQSYGVVSSTTSILTDEDVKVKPIEEQTTETLIEKVTQEEDVSSSTKLPDMVTTKIEDEESPKDKTEDVKVDPISETTTPQFLDEIDVITTETYRDKDVYTGATEQESSVSNAQTSSTPFLEDIEKLSTLSQEEQSHNLITDGMYEKDSTESQQYTPTTQAVSDKIEHSPEVDAQTTEATKDSIHEDLSVIPVSDEEKMTSKVDESITTETVKEIKEDKPTEGYEAIDIEKTTLSKEVSETEYSTVSPGKSPTSTSGSTLSDELDTITQSHVHDTFTDENSSETSVTEKSDSDSSTLTNKDKEIMKDETITEPTQLHSDKTQHTTISYDLETTSQTDQEVNIAQEDIADIDKSKKPILTDNDVKPTTVSDIFITDSSKNTDEDLKFEDEEMSITTESSFKEEIESESNDKEQPSLTPSDDSGITSGAPFLEEVEKSSTTISDIHVIDNEMIEKDTTKPQIVTHTTSSVIYDEKETVTAEPDKGLNTIPSGTFGSSDDGGVTQSLELETTHASDEKLDSTTHASPSPDLSTKLEVLSETTEGLFTTELFKSDEETKDTQVDDGKLSTVNIADVSTLSPINAVDDSEDKGKYSTTPETLTAFTLTEENIHHDQISELITQSTTIYPEKTPEATTIDQIENEIDENSNQFTGRIPGEGDCLLNSVTYKNGSSVPKTNKCHSNCKCVSSIIKCDPIICSLPPDYMQNCQPTYDSPDSCCPTYVCDQSRETMPPVKPLVHVTTTETLPDFECHGDQCEVIAEKDQSNIPQATECSGSECSDSSVAEPNKCESKDCTTSVEEPSIVPVEQSELCAGNSCKNLEEPCINGACQTPIHSPHVPPVVPCDGTQCDEPSKTSEPNLCENGEICKDEKEPDDTLKKQECSAGECKTDVIQKTETPQIETCQGDNCKDSNIPSECSDETCKEKLPTNDERGSTPCSGPSCDNALDIPIPSESTHDKTPEDNELYDIKTTPEPLVTEIIDTTGAATGKLPDSTESPTDLEEQSQDITTQSGTSKSDEDGNTTEELNALFTTSSPKEYATEQTKSPFDEIVTSKIDAVKDTETSTKSEDINDITLQEEIQSSTLETELFKVTTEPTPEQDISEHQDITTIVPVSSKVTEYVETTSETIESETSTTHSKEADKEISTVTVTEQKITTPDTLLIEKLPTLDEVLDITTITPLTDMVTSHSELPELSEKPDISDNIPLKQTDDTTEAILTTTPIFDEEHKVVSEDTKTELPVTTGIPSAEIINDFKPNQVLDDQDSSTSSTAEENPIDNTVEYEQEEKKTTNIPDIQKSTVTDTQTTELTQEEVTDSIKIQDSTKSTDEQVLHTTLSSSSSFSESDELQTTQSPETDKPIESTQFTEINKTEYSITTETTMSTIGKISEATTISEKEEEETKTGTQTTEAAILDLDETNLSTPAPTKLDESDEIAGITSNVEDNTNIMQTTSPELLPEDEVTSSIKPSTDDSKTDTITTASVSKESTQAPEISTSDKVPIDQEKPSTQENVLNEDMIPDERDKVIPTLSDDINPTTISSTLISDTDYTKIKEDDSEVESQTDESFTEETIKKSTETVTEGYTNQDDSKEILSPTTEIAHIVPDTDDDKNIQHSPSETPMSLVTELHETTEITQEQKTTETSSMFTTEKQELMTDSLIDDKITHITTTAPEIRTEKIITTTVEPLTDIGSQGPKDEIQQEIVTKSDGEMTAHESEKTTVPVTTLSSITQKEQLDLEDFTLPTLDDKKELTTEHLTSQEDKLIETSDTQSTDPTSHYEGSGYEDVTKSPSPEEPTVPLDQTHVYVEIPEILQTTLTPLEEISSEEATKPSKPSDESSSIEYSTPTDGLATGTSPLPELQQTTLTQENIDDHTKSILPEEHKVPIEYLPSTDALPESPATTQTPHDEEIKPFVSDKDNIGDDVVHPVVETKLPEYYGTTIDPSSLTSDVEDKTQSILSKEPEIPGLLDSSPTELPDLLATTSLAEENISGHDETKPTVSDENISKHDEVLSTTLIPVKEDEKIVDVTKPTVGEKEQTITEPTYEHFEPTDPLITTQTSQRETSDSEDTTRLSLSEEQTTEPQSITQIEQEDKVVPDLNVENVATTTIMDVKTDLPELQTSSPRDEILEAITKSPLSTEYVSLENTTPSKYDKSSEEQPATTLHQQSSESGDSTTNTVLSDELATNPTYVEAEPTKIPDSTKPDDKLSQKSTTIATQQDELFTTTETIKETAVLHEDDTEQKKTTTVPEKQVTEKIDEVPVDIDETKYTSIITAVPLEVDTTTQSLIQEHHEKSTELPYTEKDDQDTTPYIVELEEHTQAVESSTVYSTTQETSIVSDKAEEETQTPSKVDEISKDGTPVETESPKATEESSTQNVLLDTVPSSPVPEKTSDIDESSKIPTTTLDLDESSVGTTEQNVKKETTPTEEETTTVVENLSSSSIKPLDTAAEQELIPTSTVKTTETSTEVPSSTDKSTKPDVKVSDSPSTELPKPITSEAPIDDIANPEESNFPPSASSSYGGEPDYVEEDQAFGPGTCRYGGKVYVSAQQIPRDDPCDFCFCFRSDIICLQQSCPPPIHGCHEEPIQGFCCPRYECPVSMATTLNVTTTTTTTTTTLPPHFPTHSYKGAAQRRGCQIKGHTYKVGEVVRASSGPCLHCTCGGDGQMKCDPKACTPEPMLRQMIAAAVSAKRRR